MAQHQRNRQKLGNTPLALEAAQNLQIQLDPEKDKWWLAATFADERDILVALRKNTQAMKKYQRHQELFSQLAEADPNNTDIQRELSVSHKRVCDMSQANGDNVAALKAY